MIWLCNNLSFDKNIDKDVEETTKVYGLRKNIYAVNIDQTFIVNEVRPLFEDLARYSETARLDLFFGMLCRLPGFPCSEHRWRSHSVI